MKCYQTFLIVIAIFSVYLLQRHLRTYPQKSHPNAWLDEYEIITRNGFSYEIHEIITVDGYILEMIRILPCKLSDYFTNAIPPKVQPKLRAKKFGEPILILHGFVGTSALYLMADADKASPFLFASHGYDTYLLNCRGAPHSRRHITLDPHRDAKQYWNFSNHEVAINDQTAAIDYILNLTGFDQLTFFAHSQGGTLFYILGADRPEYNEKIKLAFCLGAPGVTRYPPNVMLRALAKIQIQLAALAEFLSWNELFANMRPVINFILTMDEWFDLKTVITFLMNQVEMMTDAHVEPEIFSSMFTVYPQTSSMKQLWHYFQNIDEGMFRYFDYYDIDKNMMVYGSEIPPRYNLSNISAKTVLYYSNKDQFIQFNDIDFMQKEMPNAVVFEVVADMFTHGDFIFADIVVDVLYTELLWLLRYL